MNDNLSVYPSIIELVLSFKKQQLINHNFCNESHINLYLYCHNVALNLQINLETT